MRYQQQQARMSPNWREKEAMSTQKLMAATTHLHLKQDEEIMRLRRNVSSLAKKNHGLIRQVHELVSRLRQYPPPRIPEDTRPTNQDEETQEDPSPETKEDTQMKDVVEPQVNDDSSLYSLFEPKPREPTPQQSIEYEILPDYVETPSPSPTPPIQQVQLRPLPPSHPLLPPALPVTASEVKSSINKTPRVEHTPLPETPIPADTHPDEKLSIVISGQNSARVRKYASELSDYNRGRQEGDVEMTLRGWHWFCPPKLRTSHSGPGLVGREGHGREYVVGTRVRNGKCIIKAEHLKKLDLDEIAKYNGKYLVGFPGKNGEEREKIQIVIEDL